MSAVVPNEGELQLLNDLLAGGSLENWSLRLFKTNVTPAESDTPATFTVADFTGYVNKTLTRSISGSTWSTPASGAPTGAWSGEAAVAESTYGSSAQSWSATSAQTIYGHYIVGATSTKLILAELWGSSISLVNPSTLQLTPRIGAA